MTLSTDELSKWSKRCIALSSDVIMTIVALLGAKWLSNSFLFQFEAPSFMLVLLLQSALYFVCGLYRGVWRFASIPDLVRIVRAVLLGASVIFILAHLAHLPIPLRMYCTYALLLICLLAGPRLLYRWFRDYRHLTLGTRVLVVGAGSAGEGIIRDLRRSPLNKKFRPIGMVDDDPRRQGCEVQGVRILGNCSQIPKIVQQFRIELILIAIPSADSTQMRQIVSCCEQSQVAFRTLPNIKDIADGTARINSLREVLLDDLLGREQVQLDWKAIEFSIAAKTILVTGGGGSIGSELCRQISLLAPKTLIIVDNNEFNLYRIDLELRKKFRNIEIAAHLCSVTDRAELTKIFKTYEPELIFHVAAYKHVPLLENHLRVAMYNNIIGTQCVAELSSQFGVKTFVLISTDKAVNPTNIMGATKRASEVFCQNFNQASATQFITVRFGNVLDSTGSVIPLFRKQLLNGGPLTVTHHEISRYFMTIPEASQLILQAATMSKNGDIFVLDMGEPINIRYLAEQMIKLSGKVVGKDIEIQYIGLRPGEKLHEELFHENEVIGVTEHHKIKRAKVRHFDWEKLKQINAAIELACQSNDESRLYALLCELVPEYKNPATPALRETFEVNALLPSLTAS